MKNKIILFILVILISFGAGTPLFAYAKSTASETDFSNDIDFLFSLGLVENDKFGKYGSEIYAVRGNFYVTLAKILNLSYDDSLETVPENPVKLCEDVFEGDKYWRAIKSLSDYGVIQINPYKPLKPSDYLTMPEVAKIFVSLLDFDEVSYYQTKGDVYTAEKIGILTDDVNTGSSFITQGELASITRRALLTNVYETIGFKGGNVVKKQSENKTLLSINKGIYSIEDVVYANQYTHLGDSLYKTDSGTALIGDLLLSSVDINLDLYLGHRVFALYRENGAKRELVYIEYCDDNDSILINQDSFVSYNNRVIKYYDGNRVKSVTVPSSADVIYNNKSLNSHDKAYFNITNGTMKLIDNNNDGKSEVVIISHYADYVVEKVDIDAEVVYVRNSAPIYLNNYTDGYEIMYPDARLADVSYLSRNDLISVMIDELSKCIRIYISDNVVEGMVSSVNSDESITIDNEVVLGLSAQYPAFLEKPAVGDYGRFYVNMCDRIAAFCQETEGFKYGYLLAYDYSAFTDVLKFKVFESSPDGADGVFSVYEAPTKIILDGKSVTKKEVYQQFTNSGFGGIIRFLCNSQNQIKIIDSCNSVVNNSSDILTVDFDSSESTTRYRYSSSSRNLGGTVLFDSEAVVFIIPTDKSDIEHFDFRSIDELIAGQYYSNFITYRTQNPYESDVIVLYDYDVNTAYYDTDTYLTILTSVAQSSNNDGELVYSVRGFYGGSEVKYKSKPGVDLSQLREGDAVRLSFDKNGDINNYELIFSSSSQKLYSNGNPNTANFYYTQFMYGGVYDVYGDSVIISTGAMEENMDRSKLHYTRLSRDIYVYDSTLPAGKRVSIGSYSDITPYTLNPNIYSKVLSYSVTGVVRNMVVVK